MFNNKMTKVKAEMTENIHLLLKYMNCTRASAFKIKSYAGNDFRTTAQKMSRNTENLFIQIHD